MFRLIISKSKMLGSFVALELIVQALALSAGLFLVRSLTKSEYAFYTIATTMQGAMSMFVDAGISVGILAIGGTIFGNRDLVGQLIKTAKKLRIFFLCVGILIIGPVTAWLLIKNNAPGTTIISITILIVIGGYFQVLQNSPLIIVRLARLQNKLQIVNISALLFRWLFLILIFFFATLSASLSLFSSIIGIAFQAYAFSKLAKPYFNESVSPNDQYNKKLIETIKKILPGSIYLMFQSQISIGLLSIFGTIESVADLGALGRIGVIFSVVTSVMANLVIPRFSQLKNEILISRYFIIIGIYVAFGVIVISASAIFPEYFLLILGEKYFQLKDEVILIVTTTCINSLAGYMWHMNASRGWIAPPMISISIGLLTQLILMAIIGVSSVYQILLISIFFSLHLVGIGIFVASKGISNAIKKN
jgi:O-antigen/teichoic acid export membrane protein